MIKENRKKEIKEIADEIIPIANNKFWDTISEEMGCFINGVDNSNEEEYDFLLSYIELQINKK